MGKKNKDGFTNRAAKKFGDVGKIDLYSESEIYDVLNDEMDIMLAQLTANRQHKGKFPTYIMNMFANISAAKYMKKYAKANKSEVDEDEKESLKLMISQGFKDSVTGKFQQQLLESEDRNAYLRDAFAILAKGKLRIAKQLKLDDDKAKELIIQVFMEPKYAIRQVCRLFDNSTVSDKKKFKIFQKLYGKRTAEAMGAALTVDMNGNDCVNMIFDKIMKSPKKKRLKYLRFYAETFKKIKKFNFLLKGDFYSKNKKIIKKLIKEDRGYKKAFDFRFGTKDKNNKRKDDNRDKKEDDGGKVFMNNMKRAASMVLSAKVG